MSGCSARALALPKLQSLFGMDPHSARLYVALEGDGSKVRHQHSPVLVLLQPHGMPVVCVPLPVALPHVLPCRCMTPIGAAAEWW
jgi:hypothetical protein